MIRPRAIRDLVVLIPIETEQISKGGILLTAQRDKRESKGIVLDVGPDVRGIVEDDFVIYEPFAGQHISLEGIGTFAIIPQEKIYATIDLEGEKDYILTYSQVKAAFAEWKVATVRCLEDEPWLHTGVDEFVVWLSDMDRRFGNRY